ncbi:MAG: outer membrane protein assembly factor BamD [Prevotellaceae bacterium]|mgnify:CR=1 FL=1|nr:outer membrane protein assembly factor BamD [Candidatus Colivivens caballi]
MKKNIVLIALGCSLLLQISCNSYNTVLKAQDYDYRYEAAKEYYAAGQYNRCYQLLEDMLLLMKGTDRGEECMIMLAMCYYNMRDYETSGSYFERYYKSYPKGDYAELARYYSGRAAYLMSPDPRLDQTSTYSAITRLQDYLEYYPYSERREMVSDMIYQLQNRLVEKDLENVKLYYNLGNYIGNCIYGGSNYEACILSAENTLKTYPYTTYREELYLYILRARYKLAVNSVAEKAEERYRQTVDEYYGFKNEFPESKHIKEAEQIFRHCSDVLKL